MPHDTSKAVSFFEKSCKMDYASGCYTIGYLLNTGRYGMMIIYHIMYDICFDTAMNMPIFSLLFMLGCFISAVIKHVN
mgnify:CR=1 FL=1